MQTQGNITKFDWKSYVVRIAHECRGNARLWMRYLRKFLDGETPKLSQELVREINATGELTMYQQVSLMRAMTPGTYTHRTVVELNQPAKTRVLDQVRMFGNVRTKL